VSEYGVIGPCHLDSIKAYLKPEERCLDSRAWREHTNVYAKETLPAAIRRHYADPEELSIADSILYGQMFQASMYGRSIEALRFRKNDPCDDCQGALIWMYNDCWGETGWTPIDYYLRRKPSYYWIRNANNPLKAIVRRRGEALVTRVVNDTLKAENVTVHFGWMRVDGSDARMSKEVMRVPGNSMLEIARAELPNPEDRSPTEWIYVAYLRGSGVALCPSIWTLLPHRELNLPEPDIKVSANAMNVRLVSKTYCHGVHFKDNGKTVFSDNYFDLLPGVPKVIKCLRAKRPSRLAFVATR
jgi:beta-mannosidase